MSKFKNVFKALQDCNRRKILSVLKEGEQCGCNILQKFDITQPTLSHHMKVLIDAELVLSRKEGLWTYYTINKNKLELVIDYLSDLVLNSNDETIQCSCRED